MVVPPTPLSKSALRRAARVTRAGFVAGLAPGERWRLEAGLAAVLDTNLPPGIVAGYAAVGSELGLGALSRAIVYPRVAADAPLTFHRCGPAELLPGALGIGEPRPDAALDVPDVVLVPLLAVDARGTRLGQGGGHYDRTLAALRSTRRILAVGVAWDVQRVAALPADPWDQPLDALATPSGWSTFVR